MYYSIFSNGLCPISGLTNQPPPPPPLELLESPTVGRLSNTFFWGGGYNTVAVGQLGAVGIRPYYQAAGLTQ